MRQWSVGVTVIGLSMAACGTRLSALDARAVRDQQRAAEAILVHVDGGVTASLAEAIYCDSAGVLRRAAKPGDDAGISCPAP
jgi:hypothetical protein